MLDLFRKRWKSIFGALFSLSLAGPVAASSVDFLNGTFSGTANWALGSLVGPNNSSGVTGGIGRLNGGAGDRSIGLKQTVSGFAIGATYEVGVDVRNFAPNFGSNTAQNFGIAVDGALIGTFSGEDLGLLASDATQFERATLQFVATDTSLTFLFVGQVTDDRSYDIDNAELSFVSGGAAPIPLPGTGVFLIGALGALALRRRRRA